MPQSTMRLDRYENAVCIANCSCPKGTQNENVCLMICFMFSAPEGERRKTVENCFYEAKSTKQGVWGFKGTKNPQTTMRLDRYENAVCKANCSCPMGTPTKKSAFYRKRFQMGTRR